MIPAEDVSEQTVLGGRYELRAPIASGAMARVWRATDRALGREVAVKVLHPHMAEDPSVRQRFHYEALAVARLSHPGIVAVFDTISPQTPESDTEGEVGEPLAGSLAGPVDAIVMELYRGGTLRHELDAAGGRLPPSRVVEVATEVLDALDAAHRAGIVHRDIKPSNILSNGSGSPIKLTDFGIAKAGFAGDLTSASAVLGTAKYVSPEQLEGTGVGPGSDLYSLGVVLYEAAVGQAPFRANTDSAVALLRLQQDPTPVRDAAPTTPATLAAAIDRLLQRNPGDRFLDAREARAVFLGQVGDLSVVDLTSAASAEETIHDESNSSPAMPSTGGQEATEVAIDLTRVELVGPAEDSADEYDRVGGNDGLAGAGVAGAGVESDDPDPDPDLDGDDDVDAAASFGGRIGMLFLFALVVAALVVLGLLVDDAGLIGDAASDTNPSPEGTSLVATESIGGPQIRGAEAFDPLLDQRENDHLVPEALDGDPTTRWATEEYRAPNFSNLKSGVGLVIELERRSVVTEIEIDSPTEGWTAEVFVADEPFGDDPEQWGEPAAAVSGDGSTVVTELRAPDGEREGLPPLGSHVLFWLTDPGRSPPDGDNRFELVELTLR